MPRHAAAVLSEDVPDLARCTRSDVLGDVAVGHDVAGRDRLDAGQDAMRELVVHPRGGRPVSAISRSCAVASAGGSTGGWKYGSVPANRWARGSANSTSSAGNGSSTPIARPRSQACTVA